MEIFYFEAVSGFSLYHARSRLTKDQETRNLCKYAILVSCLRRSHRIMALQSGLGITLEILRNTDIGGNKFIFL